MKMRLHHALLVLFVFVANSCSKESIESTDIPVSANAFAVEQELLEMINDHRASLGYNGLQYSAVAYEFANKHTDYMIAKGTISHDNFSARASSLSTRTDAEYVAENVARNYDTAAEAFASWLVSSTHRKTMEGEFSHTAVSVKEDTAGNYYFTQLFYR